MSVPTVSTAGLMPAGGAEPGDVAVIRSWKAPIGLAIFAALYGLLLLLAPRGGDTAFRLSTEADAIQLPELVVPVALTTWVCFVLLVLLAAASAYFVRSSARTPLWIIIVYLIVLVLGFLTWAASGATIPVVGLLAGTIALAVPLIYGALGGVIGERAGVVNIAIEGQLLAGAFSAAVVASITRQPLLGLIAAAVAGVLVAFVLAAFAIKYVVDQVIVGVVLNVLVIGLTSFLYSQVLQPNAALLNTPPRFDRIPIPLLSEIPVIGPVLFRQTIVVYLMYVAVALVYFGMFHTRWGLRLRAVGEHPQAADTVGIKVNATRFWNVLLAGAIAGIGGTVFTIGAAIPFNKEMTGGVGFIALAAVIFGQWDPIKATLAALLFGFASSLQNTLNIIGSPVPSEFMLMLPYLVTIFVVAGVVGKSRAPAADGKPYVKG
ncbi:ABC transporter permease [Microbacterium pumilum]|uniref:ABC transporter permease n=2 Tax=Microbacterium pumilum TaxID=344165 RepID=A0ABP5DQ98_9MICO